jgi:rubrerythrin
MMNLRICGCKPERSKIRTAEFAFNWKSRDLRMVVPPKKEFLLKQFREAYEKFVCPVCEYPIRRGPLRYAFWTKRTIRKLILPEPSAPATNDDPYTCPACGVMLYEKCPVCGGVRHSLLAYCEKCGASKEVVVPA